jgi:hypothetical protein
LPYENYYIHISLLYFINYFNYICSMERTINKQVFKGSTLYRKRVKNHILSVYTDARVSITDDWYINANLLAIELASKYGTDYVTVAGIIAALSPLKSWDENKKIAEGFLRNGKGKHTRNMINKAKQITLFKGNFQREYILNELNGNKIKSFFLNIAYPLSPEAVTIDRHAISICLNRSIKDNEGTGITLKQYNFFVSCYSELANELNIRPSMLQSVTWEKWRLLKSMANCPF